eukprot:CAMPEP_0113514604 /NCGR_PEP_ID=MMETSP0014_2-20120614/40499_1 /TAXON_ID=2857 /ORGANISM="Nitzschia sp." /LENGTH=1118 /DNA_ID=CAMNT_0000411115 /DNA_START=227 /DNA_END=3580 /DNA_ORIENTATION=- /assembly_acc=CAM_ASM_000159
MTDGAPSPSSSSLQLQQQQQQQQEEDQPVLSSPTAASPRSWSRKKIGTAAGHHHHPSASASPFSSPKTPRTAASPKSSSTKNGSRKSPASKSPRKSPTVTPTSGGTNKGSKNKNNTTSSTIPTLGSILDAKRKEDAAAAVAAAADDDASLAHSARQSWMKMDAELQSPLASSGRRAAAAAGGKPRFDSLAYGFNMSSSSLTVNSTASPNSPSGRTTGNRSLMNASIASMVPQPPHRFVNKVSTTRSPGNKKKKKTAEDTTTVVRGSRVYKIGKGTNDAQLNFLPQTSSHTHNDDDDKSWIRKKPPKGQQQSQTTAQEEGEEDAPQPQSQSYQTNDALPPTMDIVEELMTELPDVQEEEDDEEDHYTTLKDGGHEELEEENLHGTTNGTAAVDTYAADVDVDAVADGTAKMGISRPRHEDENDNNDKRNDGRRRPRHSNDVDRRDKEVEDADLNEVDKSGVREMIVDKVPTKKKRWTSRNRDNFPIWPPIIKVLKFERQNTSGLSIGSGFTNEDSLTASSGDFLSDLDEDDLSALEDLKFIAPEQRTSYRIRYDGPTNLENLEAIYDLPPVPDVDDRFDESGGLQDSNPNLPKQEKTKADSAPNAPPRRALSVSSCSFDTDLLSLNTTKSRPDVWITPLSGTQPADAVWKVKRIWEVESVDEAEEEHSVHNIDLFNKIKTLVGAPESPEARLPTPAGDTIPTMPSRVWHMQTVVEKQGEIEKLEPEKDFEEEELKDNMKKMNEEAAKEIEMNAQALEEAKKRIRKLNGYDVPDQQKTPRRAPKLLSRRMNPGPEKGSPSGENVGETITPRKDPRREKRQMPRIEVSPVPTTPTPDDDVLSPLPGGRSVPIKSSEPQHADNDQDVPEAPLTNEVAPSTPTSKKKKSKKKSVKGDSTPKTPSRRRSKAPAQGSAPGHNSINGITSPLESSPQSQTASRSVKKKKKTKSLKAKIETPDLNGDSAVSTTPSGKKKKSKSMKAHDGADSTPKTPSRKGSLPATLADSHSKQLDLNDSSNLSTKSKKKKKSKSMPLKSPKSSRSPKRSSRKKVEENNDEEIYSDNEDGPMSMRRMINAGDMVQNSDSESETESSDIHSTKDMDGGKPSSMRRLQNVTPWWQKNGG